jgi:hypothetical protein
MRILTACVISLLSLAIGTAQSPYEAHTMNAEPLRITLSKIAPLEEWNAEWSKSGPRVCWRLFRPSPEQLGELGRIISSFQKHSGWYLADNCLAVAVDKAFLAFPTTRSHSTVEAPSPPRAQLSQEQASDDLFRLAGLIEDRLGLKSSEPKLFSRDLLKREGLRRSRAPFEDFQDGGQRVIYLIVEPKASGIFEPTAADLMLHFEPSADEITAIFNEIIGADLTLGHGRALTDLEAERIKTGFPVLWKISDYYEDAYLAPHEADLLLEECVALDKVVSSSRALRGLDKLSRIAYWASSKRYGVLFSPP